MHLCSGKLSSRMMPSNEEVFYRIHTLYETLYSMLQLLISLLAFTPTDTDR